MTNPEAHYPFVHWPVRSTSNLPGIYNKTQEDCQIFHPPATPTLLTYFQQKDQAINPYSTYVISSNIHDKYRYDKIKMYFEYVVYVFFFSQCY
jgi:hypothetical protein